MASQGHDAEYIDQLFAANKEYIRKAYQGDRGRGKTLKEIKAMLEQYRDFPPLPLATHEVKLRQLGLRKKVSRDDWLPIWQHCRRIKQEGSEPLIFLNGTQLKWEKAWKEIRRNGAHKTTPPARCPSLPTHIAVVPASKSVRPIVAHERNTQVLSQQSALPSTTYEFSNTVDRVQTVAKDICVSILKKGWLVELPWLQFLSIMRVYIEGSVSPEQRSDQSIGPSIMEQLSQYFGTALDFRDSNLSLFRPHNENLTSCTALTVEFDAVYFLAKAVLRLSNRLVDFQHPSLEDRLLYTIILSRIATPFLLVFLRSDLPSARAAQATLLELTSWQGDVQTFKFLVTANNGYLQQQLGSSARFIGAAGRLGQRDMVQSGLASMTASSGSWKVLTNLLEVESESVSVLAAQTLTRLFNIGCPNVRTRLRGEIARSRYIRVRQHWNESVIMVLLEAGLDVDDVCLESHELCHLERLYDLNDVPVPWRMSIFDYQYYQSTALHAIMQPYSLKSGTVFDRVGLSGAGRGGVQALSKYLDEWRADSGVPGLNKFLQLLLVEQLLFGFRESEWYLISSLLDYGVDPSLPDIAGPSIQDVFKGMMWYAAEFDTTEICTAALQRLLENGAQLNAMALVAAVSNDGYHGLETVQALGADFTAYGPYALVEALRRANTRAVDWLITRGVDPLHSIPDGKGSCFTVLGAAISEPYRSQSHTEPDDEWYSWPIDGLKAVLRLVHLGCRPLLRPNDQGPIDLVLAIITRLSFFGIKSIGEHKGTLRSLCRETARRPSNKVMQLLEHIAIHREWDWFEEIANQGQLTGPGNPLACLILHRAPSSLIHRMFRITPDHNARTLYNGAFSLGSKLSASEAAAHVWNAELLRELVSAGSDVDRGVSDVWSNHSIWYACLSNPVSAAEAQAQIETIRYLLELGVPIDGHDLPHRKISPLQAASSKGSLEVVLLLLEHGADANKSCEGFTEEFSNPLDDAAKYGRLDVAQVLLNAGAISYTTRCTPYDGAIERALVQNHDETAKLLCRFALSKGYQLSQEYSQLLL